jgi:hypothetical protein
LITFEKILKIVTIVYLLSFIIGIVVLEFLVATSNINSIHYQTPIYVVYIIFLLGSLLIDTPALLLFFVTIYKIDKDSKHANRWLHASFVLSILVELMLLIPALIGELFALSLFAGMGGPNGPGPVSTEAQLIVFGPMILIVSEIILWMTYSLVRKHNGRAANAVNVNSVNIVVDQTI